MAQQLPYAAVLKHIETKGVPDGTGGFTLQQDKQLISLLGHLAPRRLGPAQIDDGSSVWEPYEPREGTCEYHAAECWKLAKPGEDDRYLFPLEAIEHLRKAIDAPSDFE